MIKAILFDLDGTLVDTLADIATVMNGFLQSKSWPAHTVEDYRLMVGRGLLNLIRAAVPPPHAQRAEEFYDEVFTVYDAMGIGESRPYPGATRVLEALNAAGIPIAVVSNKPDAITRNMMAGLFSDIRFALVRGGLDGVAPKPDPSSAFEAARACGVAPADCAFVGDSDVDMKTAVAAGMLPVGAAWGFRGEAELRAAGATIIAATIDEVPELVLA
jgi:phosphoglycolate phosphatase